MGCLSIEANYDYAFSEELISKTRDLNKLLTLELELSRTCNYRCRYCYTEAGTSLTDELSYEELCDVVDQAKELGARTIILIGGGEPLLYKELKAMIKYISMKGLDIILFTNGSCMNTEIAKYLYEYNVFPVLKVNGLKPKTVNWLCDNSKAYRSEVQALICLEEAGYLRSDRKIGISTIICRQNYSDIIPLWKWARENNAIPYFERVIPQGRALENDLCISKEELRKMYRQLQQLDRENYNIIWENDYMPIAGVKCNRHYYSIYVNADGSVQPCSGVDLIAGNIREQRLSDIIRESAVIQDLRHIDRNIRGKCHSCSKITDCYGCRGNAYQMERDYLASDPLCWLPSSEV